MKDETKKSIFFSIACALCAALSVGAVYASSRIFGQYQDTGAASLFTAFSLWFIILLVPSVGVMDKVFTLFEGKK